MARDYLIPETLNDSFSKPLKMEYPTFDWLRKFLNATKATKFVTARLFEDGRWWVQFKLDLNHKMIWTVIQELGYVANNMVLIGKLPVKLLPWPSAPENGPPESMLFWRIERYDGRFSPDDFVAESGMQVAKKVTNWPPKE